MLGIELMQPFQGERRAGTIAQQALAPGAVGGLDAHRAVDREATRSAAGLCARARIACSGREAAGENAAFEVGGESRARRRRDRVGMVGLGTAHVGTIVR
jgi:hypothetical protein